MNGSLNVAAWDGLFRRIDIQTTSPRTKESAAKRKGDKIIVMLVTIFGLSHVKS
jgi:hypothetical protein